MWVTLGRVNELEEAYHALRAREKAALAVIVEHQTRLAVAQAHLHELAIAREALEVVIRAIGGHMTDVPSSGQEPGREARARQEDPSGHGPAYTRVRSTAMVEAALRDAGRPLTRGELIQQLISRAGPGTWKEPVNAANTAILRARRRGLIIPLGDDDAFALPAWSDDLSRSPEDS